jgi:hypothetical protein
MKKKRTFIERWVENPDDWSFGEASGDRVHDVAAGTLLQP